MTVVDWSLARERRQAERRAEALGSERPGEQRGGLVLGQVAGGAGLDQHQQRTLEVPPEQRYGVCSAGAVRPYTSLRTR